MSFAWQADSSLSESPGKLNIYIWAIFLILFTILMHLFCNLCMKILHLDYVCLLLFFFWLWVKFSCLFVSLIFFWNIYIYIFWVLKLYRPLSYIKIFKGRDLEVKSGQLPFLTVFEYHFSWYSSKKTCWEKGLDFKHMASYPVKVQAMFWSYTGWWWGLVTKLCLT